MAVKGHGGSVPLIEEERGIDVNDQDNEYRIYKEPIN